MLKCVDIIYYMQESDSTILAYFIAFTYHYFLTGEDDHFDILTEMMPVLSSWKAIGRGLRIDSGRLDTIEESNPGKPKECLSKVLTCWLNRNYNVERFGEPTWRAVVKVVAHPAAGDNCALALRIVKQHSLTGNALNNRLLQTFR